MGVSEADHVDTDILLLVDLSVKVARCGGAPYPSSPSQLSGSSPLPPPLPPPWLSLSRHLRKSMDGDSENLALKAALCHAPHARVFAVTCRCSPWRRQQVWSDSSWRNGSWGGRCRKRQRRDDMCSRSRRRFIKGCTNSDYSPIL